MILIIGGQAQGKLNVATELLPKALVIDETNFRELLMSHISSDSAGFITDVNLYKTVDATTAMKLSETVDATTTMNLSETVDATSDVNDAEKKIIWNNFHLCTRKLFDEKLSPSEIEKALDQVIEKYPSLIIISNEIGNGIVPTDKGERYWREETGRLLCQLAERAVSVKRVICNIPMNIK